MLEVRALSDCTDDFNGICIAYLHGVDPETTFTLSGEKT